MLISLFQLAVLPGCILLLVSNSLSPHALPNLRTMSLLSSLKFVSDLSLVMLAGSNIQLAFTFLSISAIFNLGGILSHNDFLSSSPLVLGLLLSLHLLQKGTNGEGPIFLSITPVSTSPKATEKSSYLHLSSTALSKRLSPLSDLYKPFLLLFILFLYNSVLSSDDTVLERILSDTTRFNSPFPTAVVEFNKSTATFPEFLEKRFPLSAPNSPHIWMTLGGDNWETQIHSQQLFVDELNAARSLEKEKRTEIVVLCIDRQCMNYCEKNRIYAWGGYEFNRPEALLKYTYPKLQGLVDILTTGRDVFFFDADVYWKSDP